MIPPWGIDTRSLQSNSIWSSSCWEDHCTTCSLSWVNLVPSKDISSVLEEKKHLGKFPKFHKNANLLVKCILLRYNLEDFYQTKFIGPLTNMNIASLSRYFYINDIQWSVIAFTRIMLLFFYFAYIIVVPYCYLRIYLFRRKHKMPGEPSKAQQAVLDQRRKRNHVTFLSNMIIWLIETICSVIVG